MDVVTTTELQAPSRPAVVVAMDLRRTATVREAADLALPELCREALAAGMSLRRVAALAGISHTQVKRYGQGRRSG